MAEVHGLFVVLEGIDGSGKSTTAGEIHARLVKAGVPALQLREPTEKTDASREIRRILRTAQEVNSRVSAELLELFLIDRLWDINHQIEPALRTGKVVLLDRYFLSTAAYQAENATETQKIMAGYLQDTRILIPDIILYLNLPVKTALSRLTARAAKDVFETEVRLTRIAERYQNAFAIFREKKTETHIIEKSNTLTDGDFEAITSTIIKRVKV